MAGRVFFRTRSSLVVLWLATLPLVVAAQFQPINITHRIGYDTVPTFARIQAAATNGTSTLVAWGAADDVGGATIGRLYYQVRSAADSGRPRLLVDTSFRPAKAVAVAPLGAGFIVVWGDRRTDAPGVYSQRVALDGVLAGAPTYLQSSSTALSSIETFVTVAGVTLIWSDSLGELSVHRFARDGSTLIDRASIGRRTTGGARRLAGQPDLIEIPTADGVIIVDGANRIRPVSSTLSQRFALAHMLFPDSSVVVLRDSTILRYPSAFSDQLLDSVVLPIPPGALALTALAIAGDSIIVLYPVFSYQDVGPDYVRIEFTALSWIPGGEPRRRVAHIQDVYAGSSSREGVRIQSATATRLCGNRTLVTVVVRFSEWRNPGYYDVDVHFYFLVSSSGAITASSGGAAPIDDCAYDDTTRPFPRVTRTSGLRGMSSVTVLGDTLLAPTRRFPSGVDETEPNVFLDRGKVCVSFHSARIGFSFMNWADAGLDSARDAPPFIVKEGRSSAGRYRRIRGASILERLEAWPGTMPQEPAHGRHVLKLFGASWPTLYETHDSPDNVMLSWSYSVSVDGLEIAGVVPVNMRETAAQSGSILGPLRWTRDVTGGKYFRYSVYLDTGRLLLMHPRGPSSLSARIVGPAITKVDTFTVSDIDSIVTALPAGPDRYFLISIDRSDKTILIREKLVKGATLSTTLLPPVESLRDAYFLLDPSDTSVAIVASSDIGVLVTRASRRLAAAAPWKSIAEGAHLIRPSAYFHGDTLYAAWSDTSSADADIFGVAIPRSEIPRVIAQPDPPPGTQPGTQPFSFATSPVWPTPAQTRATLRMDVPEIGRLAVHLFDTRGRLVRTIERDIASPGWIEVTLDVSDLIDGIYELRASVGSRTAHTRIAVVHDWRR